MTERCKGFNPHHWLKYEGDVFAYAKECSKCGLMQIPDPHRGGVHWINATKAEFESKIIEWKKHLQIKEDRKSHKKQVEIDRLKNVNHLRS